MEKWSNILREAIENLFSPPVLILFILCTFFLAFVSSIQSCTLQTDKMYLERGCTREYNSHSMSVVWRCGPVGVENK